MDLFPCHESAAQRCTALLGATTPSLIGEELAIFSLSLSEESAVILKQAFEKGSTSVGVASDRTMGRWHGARWAYRSVALAYWVGEASMAMTRAGW